MKKDTSSNYSHDYFEIPAVTTAEKRKNEYWEQRKGNGNRRNNECRETEMQNRICRKGQCIGNCRSEQQNAKENYFFSKIPVVYDMWSFVQIIMNTKANSLFPCRSSEAQNKLKNSLYLYGICRGRVRSRTLINRTICNGLLHIILEFLQGQSTSSFPSGMWYVVYCLKIVRLRLQ